MCYQKTLPMENSAEKVFRHREVLAQDDASLFCYGRFPRAIIIELCSEPRLHLDGDMTRRYVLPVTIQVLITLGFLGHSSENWPTNWD